VWSAPFHDRIDFAFAGEIGGVVGGGLMDRDVVDLDPRKVGAHLGRDASNLFLRADQHGRDQLLFRRHEGAAEGGALFRRHDCGPERRQPGAGMQEAAEMLVATHLEGRDRLRIDAPFLRGRVNLRLAVGDDIGAPSGDPRGQPHQIVFELFQHAHGHR
jgi:hypothetical protein